jgi:DNA-binding NtrC family response regulator
LRGSSGGFGEQLAGDSTLSTVLIIDDEPRQLSHLRETLGGEDCDLDLASSAAELRAILLDRGNDVAAILLDGILPDIEGVELLLWIKSEPDLTDLEVIPSGRSMHTAAVFSWRAICST